MHQNSLLLFERYAREFFKPGMKVLEIGPDWHPSHYAAAVADLGLVWHTIDLSENPALTYRALDEYHFPIADDAYDLVISGQVLEHVRKIWIWIREVARVCKPGGIVITINPVSWPYHEAPVDCWRVYPEGMRALYEDAGLHILRSQCESIEGQAFARVIAGRGRDWQGHDELERTDRLASLGVPTECSLDTITVGRKPQRAESSQEPSVQAAGSPARPAEAPAAGGASRSDNGRAPRDEYGIYTAADENFFPGVVVQHQALRQHGYTGKLAVIDTGLLPWMRDYLADRDIAVISMDFVRNIRFTDVLSDETAGMRGWSFKAFGILQADLFESFTFIDADYIPLCNLETELYERIRRGEFLCTEDGWNSWNETHAEAVGVRPGTYLNINAGFFSASLRHHRPLLEEWRNLMTRRKPFDLWYGDQGALNVILDKYAVPKVLVGDKAAWNQTAINERLTKEGQVVVESVSPAALRYKSGQRIYGWHGCGWHRYWHGIGIDHYRQDFEEIEKMRRECSEKIPAAVLEVFKSLLLQDTGLAIDGHRLVPADTLRCRKRQSNGDAGRRPDRNRATRKVFIDCGIREGDATAAFLGDQAVGGGAFARCLRPRADADEFELIGFEAADCKSLPATRDRFSNRRFQLIEKLVWTFDGAVAFDSDGQSADCRLIEVSRVNDSPPWRHPNPAAVVRDLPCIDLAGYLLDNFTEGDYVVLKLDIEGAEYDVLQRLIETGAVSRIRELYVEYHWWGRTSLRSQIESNLQAHPGIYYRNDWP